MAKGIKVKTMDGSVVWVMENQIAAIAEITSSTRTEGYTKIYIPGFEIKTKTSAKSIVGELGLEVRDLSQTEG